MLWVQCINKIRDINNVITDYEIADLKGERRTVSKDALKIAILTNKASVINLKLTKDGKLINRSTEEQAELMKKLSLGVVTDKDNGMYAKARMLGSAPLVNEQGETVEWPDINPIYITPNVKYIVSHGNLRDKTVIFTGSNEIRFSGFELYDKAIIQNPTVVTAVAKFEITANTVIFDFNNMDLKILDIIFKRFKEDINQATFLDPYGQYGTMIIDDKRLNCDDVYNKVSQILKRQKPSSKNDRRCYDIIAYLRLIYSMYLSYNNKSILSYADNYISEYRSKFSSVYKNSGFWGYVSGNRDATEKLITNIENNK